MTLHQNTSRIITLLICTLSGVTGILGQPPPANPLTPTWPQLAERGLVAGRTFDVSSIENISLENGAMNLNIPLASFPAGPGGSSYGLGLVFNSQLFETGLGSTIYANNGSGDVTISTQLKTSSHGGGWSYSWRYSINYEQKEFPTGATCGGDDSKRHRLNMVFPDGSQHLLHLKGFNSDSSGYYPVNPISGSYQQNCTTTSTITAALVYYTDDGTFARLELNLASADWTLYQKDGGRVQGNGINNPRVDKVIDRNNNAISFVSAIVNGFPAVTMQDELGRTIMLEHSLNIPQDILTGPGANGSTLQWKIMWGTSTAGYQISYKCANGNLDFCSIAPYTGGVTSIQLPSVDASVLKYVINYNSNAIDLGRGEIKSIRTPYGVTANYQYLYKAADNMSAVDGDQSNPVTSKNLNYGDSTGAVRNETWTYGAWSLGTTGSTKFVTYPDGGVRTYVQRDLSYDPSSQRRIGAIIEPNGDRLDRVWRRNCPIQIYNQQPGNPYIKAEFRLVKSSLGEKTSAQLFSYDRNGNMVTQSAYDFGTIARDANGFPSTLAAPSGSALIRSIANTYALNPGASLDGDQAISCGASSINAVDAADAYWNPKPSGSKLDSLSATETSAGSVQSRTELTYDNAPNTGNVTLQRQWDNTKPAGYSVPLTDSNSIKSLYAYDAWGNVSSTTDPNGNVSSFVVNGCSGATKSAYPTSVTVGGLTLAQTWDCSGGLLKTATDPNLVQTKRTYDNLGRTTLIQEAFGTLTERQTAIQYTEISTDIGGSLPLTVTTKSDLAAKADQLLVTTKKFDQRGQIAESVQPDGSITRHLSPVAFSWESFTYEAVSNPYVSGTESTAGWTLTWRDQLGRVSRTSHYSGSDLPYPWGNNTASSGSTTSVYNGYSTISQDENNRSRQVIVDAQGRLKTVVEDQRNSGYATTYTYDGLDNLTGVNQGGLPHKR